MKNLFLITCLLASVSSALAQLPIKMKRVGGAVYAISDDLVGLASSGEYEIEFCEFYTAAMSHNGKTAILISVKIKNRPCWVEGQTMKVNFDNGNSWVYENRKTSCEGSLTSLAWIKLQDYPEQYIDHEFINLTASSKITSIEMGKWTIDVTERQSVELQKTFAELTDLIDAY